MPTNEKLINKYLKKKYGCADDGRQHFRVMFSDFNYTEKRRGEFNIFYHDIYLRTDVGVKDVPKYTAFNLRERFVLEGLVFAPNPELPESINGHYEMLWPFVNFHDNSFLPPNARVCDLIIHAARVKKRSSQEIKSFYEKLDEDQQKKEEEEFRLMIEENAPYIAMQIKEGSGTGYGTKSPGR